MRNNTFSPPAFSLFTFFRFAFPAPVFPILALPVLTFPALTFLVLTLLVCSPQSSMGQPPVPSMNTSMNNGAPSDSVPKQMPGMNRKDHMHMNMNMPMDSSMDMNMDMSMDSNMDMGTMMQSAYSLNLPMNRNGSGTSWLPDATTMRGYMVHSGGWMFMFHGDIFPRYNAQDIFHQGSRGGSKWDAPDMVMAMGQRKIGEKGLLHVNLMMSTDALIAGGSGYPLLFQIGESWQGKPLVDRQHPHDLFSELSVSYAYALSKKADVFAYLGYPGEPALGPVTFMHRPSGMFDPDAPIGHHWEDATHITFGVATLGVRVGQFKLEGSSFTGREPDENRYNFDKPRFDSWSGRLSFNPTENWAIQVSHGYVKSPESLRPDENVNRTTASATYVYPFTAKTNIAATALWGQNKSDGQPPSNAVLLEATLKWNRLVVYMRYEWVQKSVEELNLDPALFGPSNTQFPLQTLTLGIGYDLFFFAHLTVAGGGQLSAYRPPSQLTGLYGQTPLAGEVYLHLYPGIMK